MPSCIRLNDWVDDKTPPHALPGDRAVWPRDRVVDVLHMKVDVRLDVLNKGVRGTVTHTVAPMNDGRTTAEFDAIDMEIQSVLVAKQAAHYRYDGAKLFVDLGARKKGQEVLVAIQYAATPRIGLYFISPDEGYPEKPTQVWSQCQDEDTRYWIPCFDHPSEKQTTEMIATVPGTWFALSNGRLLREKKNKDGTKTFHWHQDRPHSTYVMTLAAGEFSRIEASHNGLNVDYFVEPKDLARGELTFKNTPEMIRVFEEITGVAYPWAKYSQIVVRDFVFGGMENTSATTMTETILVDKKTTKDYSSDPLISHELAHMWYGDLLTCRDWSHGWLNESFATYMEMLWDERFTGVDEYRRGAIENTNLYVEERYRRPIVTNVFHQPIDIFDRHLYEKGSVVLHTLRGVLGDEQFFRSIQRYTRDNQDHSVITQDLVNAIAAETGRNMEWFFDQWVYRPGHPTFKVSWAWDEEAKLATLSVKQTQSTDDGTPSVFRAPLSVDFRTGRAKPTAFKVEVNQREQTFVFPLSAKPDLCRFDPYNWVLKELDFEKSTGELRLQLRLDDDIAGRQRAAADLGKKGGSEAIAALEDAVTGDKHWSVQAAAAKALGVARSSAAREALLRTLNVRHPKARRAVVAALGEFTGNEGVFAALVPLAKRDASYFVESEANRSIGKLRLPGSLEVLKTNIKRPSYREIVRQGCINGFVELRDEEGLDEILAAAEYGAPAQARQVAISALGRLGRFFENRKKALGETLAYFTNDPDFRVRIAAANALVTIRAEDQMAALENMAAKELDGRGVRTAREAAGRLRKGGETTTEVKALREEFEKLRQQNGELRDKVERLETLSGRHE
ncbi:MAG: M1 family aminopeptidase [Anaerolineaceae bacterium]